MDRINHDGRSEWSVKDMLKVFFVCAALIVNGFVTGTACAAQSGDEKVAFRWAFGAMAGGIGDAEIESITRDAVLKKGERFKMMVELVKPCFIYLFHHDAQGGLSLLFPENLQQFEGDYKPGRKYYIPRGAAWFELDGQVGKETFYLLASPDRMKELEGLLGQFESSDPANREEAKKRLLEEILALRKKHRDLAAPAERPVTIGGTVRSLEMAKRAEPSLPDVSSIADELRSNGPIVRTFTVEHQ